MTAYSEENIKLDFNKGMYTADLHSAIPNGYAQRLFNLIATGTSLENRKGLKSTSVFQSEPPSVSLNISPTLYYAGGESGNSNNPILFGEGTTVDDNYLLMVRERDPDNFTQGDWSNGTTYVPLTSGGSYASLIGALNYNDRTYVFTTAKIYKVTGINWNANTSTKTEITGPTGLFSEPIHFMDRLWVAGGNTLYYTDAISSPGAYPETWNVGTNFIKVMGRLGGGKIYKLVPLGSRIYIFTSIGLFALTITGSPSDWYLRPIDEKACVTSRNCAVEVDGVIYYVSKYGVYALMGGERAKLSDAIGNYFVTGPMSDNLYSSDHEGFDYSLHFMDNGLLLNISHYFFDEDSYPFIQYGKDKSVVFYARLNSLAWTLWDFSSGSEGITLVGGIADNISTYVDNVPVTFLNILHTQRTMGDPGEPHYCEMFQYTGTQDSYIYDSLGDPLEGPVSYYSQTDDIKCHVTSAIVPAGSPIEYKILKYAYLNVYMSNYMTYSDPDSWNYYWIAWPDQHGPHNDEIRELTIENGDAYNFNMVKLNAGFTFRVLYIGLEFSTASHSLFKIKELNMLIHDLRDGPYGVQ